MRTYVYDDGRTESVLSFSPGRFHYFPTFPDFWWDLSNGPLPPVRPVAPQIVFEPTFTEDYGLPRGATLASGSEHESVDAEQFVTIRKKLRAEDAAWGILHLEYDRGYQAYTKMHSEYRKQLAAWMEIKYAPSKPVAKLGVDPHDPGPVPASASAFWWGVVALAIIMAIIIGVAK